MNNILMRKVAVMAKNLLNGEVLFSDFTMSIPDSIKEDVKIEKLVDLIEHMPGKTGFFGANLENTYNLRVKEIEKLIEELMN